MISSNGIMFCLLSVGAVCGNKMRIMAVKAMRILRNENSDIKLE
jgi:hypothetical protein